MRLHLDPTTGRIPDSYPGTFYRVERGVGFPTYIADFDNRAEAERFAIEDSGRGNRDHRVATMHIMGRA